MKFVGIFLIVVQLAVLVSSESCSGVVDGSECTHMTCDPGWQAICRNSVCTCEEVLSCPGGSKDECAKYTFPRHCQIREWHCIDNTCFCR